MRDELISYIDTYVANQKSYIPPTVRVEHVEIRCQKLIGRGEGAEMTGGSGRRILDITASPVDVGPQVRAACLTKRRD